MRTTTWLLAAVVVTSVGEAAQDGSLEMLVPNGRIAYVLVNGVVVVEGGEHTGARPGKVIRGPGFGKASRVARAR